jgi:phosphodiesterase/alkaline phosphatase D-like protein
MSDGWTRRRWIGSVGGALAAGALWPRGLVRADGTPGARLRWCWTGAVSSDRATIVTAIDAAATVEIALTAPDGSVIRPRWREASAPNGIFRFVVTGLAPDTRYRYEVSADLGDSLGGGSFHTFPAPGKAASFRVAMASCNDRRANPVFAAIARQEPLLFMLNGDFFYDNINSNDPQAFRAAYERELGDPALAALWRTCAVSYVWDDHDYGANNSGHDNPSRESAHTIYRERVPHWPLPLPARPPSRPPPIFQAFSIGRVRFILTDLRSEAQREKGTILGRIQRERLFAEMATSARTHRLIVWMSSVPWIDADDRDGWGGAQEERRLVANFLKQQRIPVCIVSGDAHMVAIDDGRNADYADGGGAPIPVFQAGALGQGGSYKGGPYSHGAHPGEGQFGLMDVQDDGTTLTVSWSARDGSDGLGDKIVTASLDGEGLIAYTFQLK